MASSKSARYSVEKLDNNNYAVWSYKMEMLLKNEKVWSMIKDNEPKTDKNKWAENDHP